MICERLDINPAIFVIYILMWAHSLNALQNKVPSHSLFGDLNLNLITIGQKTLFF